jgi:hypothetical protein
MRDPVVSGVMGAGAGPGIARVRSNKPTKENYSGV